MPDNSRDVDIGYPVDEQTEIATQLRILTEEEPYAEDRAANDGEIQ